ncbi:hypothetical protein MYP_1892 [Sporocytophaga myxococcoides]|uniref:Uncharacterized protein n=1 Tax=Sporocytophaga myxococcoides TaxID=153721 RepID=A0A098LDY5_9BACT|nr:hypothetical protein [Sporocytophaga myxococcoides]GAL84664.1 hypothetical protein MYP_1892 [Sporocytophaga myxococcoides]
MDTLISDSENLILFLIKADLRANKLLACMQEAGFTSGYYYTDLYVAIFDLMNFTKTESEAVADLYVQCVEEFCKLEINEFYSRQNEIANTVYKKLLELK